MLVVLARYTAKKGMGDRVEAALREMAPLSRAEEGCTLYLVSRLRDDPDRFFIYEHYRDEAALDAHRASPHFQRIIVGTVLPLLEKREVELATLVEA